MTSRERAEKLMAMLFSSVEPISVHMVQAELDARSAEARAEALEASMAHYLYGDW